MKKDGIRIPKVGQIIYYDGIVRHYYRVVEIKGAQGKLEFLGQNPNNDPLFTSTWNFEDEQNNPTKEKYK